MSQEKASWTTRLRQPRILLAIIVLVIAVVTAAAIPIFLGRQPPSLKVDTGTSPQIRYLVFNVQTAPFNDVRLRQAIAYAADRDAINTNVFGGLTQPLYSMIPPAMPFSQPVFQTTYGSVPNLAQAQGLLTQMGLSTTNRLNIDLWYNSDGHYGDTEPDVALVLKSSLEKTGMLIVSLKSEPWATYTDDFGNGRLPFFLLGWYPDYFDSDDYVSPFLSTAGAQALGSRYSNATVDQWISQEQAATDASARAPIFQQIQDQLARDVPYMPLWQGSANIIYRSDITGVYLHPVVFKYFVMNRPGATTLTVGTTDSVTSFDPASAYDYFSIEVINQVFDTLLVYEPQTTKLVPGLATEVPTVANGGISADGLTYTYHLRQGVKFHDGSAFNSTVMKWSIERTIGLDLPGSAAFLLYDVAKLGTNPLGGTNPNIETPDANTVVFRLSQRVGFFNDLMAFSVSAPVSMQSYSKTAQQPDTFDKVVGTGPYEVTAYTAKQQITLEKNSNYYNPGIYSGLGVPSIPVLDKIILNLYSDATTLKNAIQTFQIDMAYRTLNPDDVVAFQNQYG